MVAYINPKYLSGFLILNLNVEFHNNYFLFFMTLSSELNVFYILKFVSEEIFKKLKKLNFSEALKKYFLRTPFFNDPSLFYTRFTVYK